MKKFLLILLLPLLAFASEYKSRFFAGGIIAYSKIRKTAEFCGNGNIQVLGGWEFRPIRWLSLSPAIVFERNGWSWDRAGHTGSISYFNPYFRLGLGVHIRDFVFGAGGSYGRPFFFGGELDGKKTTSGEFVGVDYSGSMFFSGGYVIKDHYRVGLIQRMDGLHMSDYSNDVKSYSIGVFFDYLFD